MDSDDIFTGFCALNLNRLRSKGGFYSTKKLEKIISENLTDGKLQTAKEAGKFLYIWVTDLDRATSKIVSYSDSPLDKPFDEFLLASCCIPGIFPPQNICNGNGETSRYVDGGVVANNPIKPEWLDQSGLAGLQFAINVCPFTSEEKNNLPWYSATIDAAMKEQVRNALSFTQKRIPSLQNTQYPPLKFYVIQPSKKLRNELKNFTATSSSVDFALGVEDANNFLAAPHLRNIEYLNCEPTL